MGSRMGACLAVWVMLMWASPASAFDMQTGVNMRAGVANFWRSADSADVDSPPVGGGYGVQIYGLWRPLHELAVGLNVGMSGSSHDGDFIGTSMPSVGLMLRTNDVLADNWSFVLWANFMFGTANIGAQRPAMEPTFGGGTTEANPTDVLGVGFGLQALYRFRLVPDIIYFELGPYVELSYLIEDGAVEASEVQAIGVAGGVVIQANFDVTL